MQREKLYNLYTTAFFIGVLFVFKMDKTFSDQILTVRKKKFLTYDEFIVSCFIFQSPNMFFQNQIYQSMQHEKLYNFHYTTLLIGALFFSKTDER